MLIWTFISLLSWFFVLLPWIAAAVFTLFCLARMGNADSKSETKKWIAWALAPTALIALVFGSFAYDEASRARFVSGLERLKLDGKHPDRLIVHGYLMDAELAVLLHLYDFDTIEMYQDKPERATRGSRVTRAGSSGCREQALRWMTNRSYALDKSLANCIDRGNAVYKASLSDDGAVVFLMGHATTLKASNTVLENYELRLVERGENRLVDYWERYYSTRKSSLLCMAQLPFCTSKHNPKDPSRLQFVIRALGHELPSKRS